MQKPATTHKIQGVVMTIDKESFTLSPDPQRIQKVITQLKEIKLQNDVHPEEAMRLAGKIQFMTETMAGQVMKSCLKPLYQRAYHGDQHGPLNEALQDAIDTMIHLLQNIQPKIVRFHFETPAVLYADAYFQAGDQKIRISQAPDHKWDCDANNLLTNGWGFVLHTQKGTFYANGSIPGHMLGRFTERNAFIYALEIMAQMIAIITTRHLLENSSIWCWIDNEPGRTALRKGCGRDRKVNRLLAALWTYITKEGLDPHWRRVCSAANIADAVSRGDLELARKMGWTQIEHNWPELYDQISKCTKSLQHALQSHKGFSTVNRECETMATSSRTTMVGNPSGPAPTSAASKCDRRAALNPKGSELDAKLASKCDRRAALNPKGSELDAKLWDMEVSERGRNVLKHKNIVRRNMGGPEPNAEGVKARVSNSPSNRPPSC
eukprot:s29_g20.t1